MSTSKQDEILRELKATADEVHARIMQAHEDEDFGTECVINTDGYCTVCEISTLAQSLAHELAWYFDPRSREEST